MRAVLTASEMRAVDAHLIATGVPGLVLMENAGRGAAHLIGLRERPRSPTSLHAAPAARGLGGSCVRCADERALGGARIAVVCGTGNDGGDGSVVARHLLARGADVELFLVGDEQRLAGDAQVALAAFVAVGGAVSDGRQGSLQQRLGEFGLLVDALLGTGARGAPAGVVEAAIRAINGCGRPVVALDVPSGLDATTGARAGACVVAEHTVTFGFLKTGLLTTSGFSAAGRVTVTQLGVPAKLPAGVEPQAFLLEEDDVRASLVRRDPAVHKVQAGRVVIVGGSPGMTGAPNLAGRAALRAGAGLVTVLLPPGVSWGEAGELPALMTRSSPWPPPADTRELVQNADALVVGPGLGRSPDAKERTLGALALGRPTVLDADGLRAMAGDVQRMLAHPALVLTPHSGEAGDLLGITAAQVEADRFSAARRLAAESGAIVLLKGPRTLIAEPNGRVCVSAFGTSALATAGSGDVLAGIVAGLLTADRSGAPQERVQRATLLGAALHGLAAELWSETGGDAGLLATDLVELVPQVRARLLREPR